MNENCLLVETEKTELEWILSRELSGDEPKS